MSQHVPMPYWRLSSFYFFYFASLGALIPYWALYLESLDFTPRQIGELMAILMATKIIAPNVWGWIADHTGRGMQIVRVGSLLAAVSFAIVPWVEGYWRMAAAMLLFSFFWNAVLPQFEAVTLEHLGGKHHRYSSIRLWGSVGFIFAVSGLGVLLDQCGIGILLPLLMGLLIAKWVCALMVTEPKAGSCAGYTPSLRSTLARPEVLGLLAGCFLMQAGHGPYYTFYTLYMEQHGYTRSAIGQLWALGVVAEIGVFLAMPRLVLQFGLERLLTSALLLASLRWLLIGLWPDRLELIVAAQLLHAASFGVFHGTAIALVHRLFAGRNHGRGQALYSSIGFGAGGAAGALFGGYLWEVSGPSSAFIAAVAVSLSGWMVVRWTVSNPN